MKLFSRFKKKKSNRPHTRFGPIYDKEVNKLRDRYGGYFGYIYALPTGELTKEGKKL